MSQAPALLAAATRCSVSTAVACVRWLQGFSNPSVFDPDRFSPERKEDIKYQKNFLTFGHGPHYCVGKDYAVNQIICYLANLSTRSVLLVGSTGCMYCYVH